MSARAMNGAGALRVGVRAVAWVRGMAPRTGMPVDSRDSRQTSSWRGEPTRFSRRTRVSYEAKPWAMVVPECFASVCAVVLGLRGEGVREADGGAGAPRVSVRGRTMVCRARTRAVNRMGFGW
ncbi:hypothetical protein Aple_078160 [Acrocarpospora pleiomorpha]|uniref:Uncharacterized protein n=1 Tax=Acrocarpospora pleiomorpha TaxID=90975 RepID=A0A5M3XUP8_9ACTN|nr:hypothetical protein Aple_078160 [Acrocarpospora pleiomorpha]